MNIQTLKAAIDRLESELDNFASTQEDDYCRGLCESIDILQEMIEAEDAARAAFIKEVLED